MCNARPCSQPSLFCRDEVELVDSFCSGRRSCLLPVATFVEKNIDPCPNVPKELKSYLTVGYHCEAGVVLILTRSKGKIIKHFY